MCFKCASNTIISSGEVRKLYLEGNNAVKNIPHYLRVIWKEIIG